MSMIDYGAIVIKNGVWQKQDDWYMDMQEAVGWVYPSRIKYPDCKCVDDRGFSDCCKCGLAIHDRRKRSPGYTKEKVVLDCKGSPIYYDENRIDGNYYVYVGDHHFTAAFYMHNSIFCLDGIAKRRLFACNASDGAYKYRRKSATFTISGIKVNVRIILDMLYVCKFTYNNDEYTIVYGYGVNTTAKTIEDIVSFGNGMPRSRYDSVKVRQIMTEFIPELRDCNDKD